MRLPVSRRGTFCAINCSALAREKTSASERLNYFFKSDSSFDKWDAKRRASRDFKGLCT